MFCSDLLTSPQQCFCRSSIPLPRKRKTPSMCLRLTPAQMSAPRRANQERLVRPECSHLMKLGGRLTDIGIGTDLVDSAWVELRKINQPLRDRPQKQQGILSTLWYLAV